MQYDSPPIPALSKEFDKRRKEDVQQSIFILFIILAIVLFASVVWAMYESELKRPYWAASIVSEIFISVQTWISYYLYKHAMEFDKSVNSKKDFMKKMKIQDILSAVTGIVCIVAIITSGWLGFTFTKIRESDIENLSPTPSDEEIEAINQEADRNGQISGALLGLNLMGIMVGVLCVWANYKFRAYLRTQPEASMSPEEYEAHIINTGRTIMYCDTTDEKAQL